MSDLKLLLAILRNVFGDECLEEGRNSYPTDRMARILSMSKVVYIESDKYHFFLTGLIRRNTSLSGGSQRLRPGAIVRYLGDYSPSGKSSICQTLYILLRLSKVKTQLEKNAVFKNETTQRIQHLPMVENR